MVERRISNEWNHDASTVAIKVIAEDSVVNGQLVDEPDSAIAVLEDVSGYEVV